MHEGLELTAPTISRRPCPVYCAIWHNHKHQKNFSERIRHIVPCGSSRTAFLTLPIEVELKSCESAIPVTMIHYLQNDEALMNWTASPWTVMEPTSSLHAKTTVLLVSFSNFFLVNRIYIMAVVRNSDRLPADGGPQWSRTQHSQLWCHHILLTSKHPSHSENCGSGLGRDTVVFESY